MGDWLDELTDAEKSIILLESVDSIPADDIAGPATYNEIRYMPRGFYNIDDLSRELGVEDKSGDIPAGFGLDFSNPPEELENSLEKMIEDLYSIGDTSYSIASSKLAQIALEAGELGKNTRGELGYVLMSDFSEYLPERELDSLAIPDYFLDDITGYKRTQGFRFVNDELRGRPRRGHQRAHGFYLFEGELRGNRDRKIAAITEDETAMAWIVGRTLEKFDIDPDFRNTYNETITNYVDQRDSERS